MEHTEIKTIELESRGKKRYRDDASDVDIEEESQMDYPKRFNDRYP